MRSLAALVLLVAASSAAAPVERRLHIATAQASSYDRNDYNRFEENYLPLYVADDDPATAWTEGVPGDGAGQWLRVHFSPMKGATRVRLRIRNGYQKSHKLFVANERARKVTFTLSPAATTVQRELTDTEGWQEVVLSLSAGTVSGVEMKVDSVFAGTKYADLCISDVQVFVTAETPDNPAFEKGVFEKVKKWKADRVTAAAAFGKAQKGWLPVSSAYDVQDDAVPQKWKSGDAKFDVIDHLDLKRLGPDERAVLAEVKGWLGTGAAAFEPVLLGTGGRPKLPEVDGLCAPSLGSACTYDACQSATTTFENLPLLTTDAFKLIEARDRPAVASLFDDTVTKKVKGCDSRSGEIVAWAVRQGEDRRTRALLVMGCRVVEGREGSYVASSAELLAYDANGRLRLTATPSVATTYTWAGEGAAAKISGGSFLAQDTSGIFTAAKQLAAASPPAQK